MAIRPLFTSVVALLAISSLVFSVQRAQAAPGDPPGGVAPARPKPREFAEGVLTTIPLNRSESEAVDTPVDGSRSPFEQPKHYVELLERTQPWTPNFAPETSTLDHRARNIIPRRGIWQLEFTFKPFRLIEIDMPQPDGSMKKQVVWYMVYKVSNVGGHFTAEKQADGLYKMVQVAREGEMRGAVGPIYFFPKFVLRSHETGKVYPDKLIPVALEAIRRKETPTRRLLNTTKIGASRIPLSEQGVDRGVWGVVTWTGIDPRTDYFSVYVQGLTNAYQYYDKPGARQPADPLGKGRVYNYKTLKLNFYKPGDEFETVKDKIQYGIKGQLDHEWLYMP